MSRLGRGEQYEFEAGLRRRLKPSHKMYEGIILELSSRGNLEDTRKAIYWLQHMRVRVGPRRRGSAGKPCQCVVLLDLA